MPSSCFAEPGRDLAGACPLGGVLIADRLRAQVKAGVMRCAPAADRRADRRHRGGTGFRQFGWSAPSPRRRASTSGLRELHRAGLLARVYAIRIQVSVLHADDQFPPNLGLAAILLWGGREVIHGMPSAGAFIASTPIVDPISPMPTLGYMLGAAQRLPPRDEDLPDPRLGADDRYPRPTRCKRCRRATDTRAYERAGPTLEGGITPGAEPTSTSTCLPDRRPPPRRRYGLGKVGAGVTKRPRLKRGESTRRGSPHDARCTYRRSRRKAKGASWLWSPTIPSCSLATVHDNIAYARMMLTAARRCSRPLPPRRPTASSSACPSGYDTMIGERGLTPLRRLSGASGSRSPG